MDEKEERAKTVSFDGRLYFHQTFNHYMNDYRLQMLNGDYVGALTTLRQMLSMMNGVITPKSFDRIKKNILSARSWSANKLTTGFVPDKINDIYDDIQEVGKVLLLPVSTDEEEEFDMERFFAESDL